MIPAMAELVGSRGDRHIWMTRAHLAALALMTVCIAVLSFFVGLKVGQAEQPVGEDPTAAAFLPDPADGDALEALLDEVERARAAGDAPRDLGFPEELKAVEQPSPPAPSPDVSAPTAAEPARGDLPSAPEGAGAGAAPTSGWAVQIAALESQAEADALVERLVAEGFAAYRVEALVRGETWYRVRVGGYETREEAETGQGELERSLGRSDLLIAKAP